MALAHPLMLVSILKFRLPRWTNYSDTRQLCSKLRCLQAPSTEVLEVLQLMAATSTSVPLEDLSMRIVMDWMEMESRTSLWLDSSNHPLVLWLAIQIQQSLA